MKLTTHLHLFPSWCGQGKPYLFWFKNMSKSYYTHVKIILLLLLKCVWNHAVLNNCLIAGKTGVSWDSDWGIWKHDKSIYGNAMRRKCWKGCCESLILRCHLKQSSVCCRTNQCNAVLIIKETYLLYMYCTLVPYTYSVILIFTHTILHSVTECANLFHDSQV